MIARKPAPMIRQAVAWLFAGWAVLLTWYFLYLEGLIAWFPGAQIQHHPGAYLTILSSVGGEFRVWWGNIPWLDLGWAALAIALYAVAGRLLIDCFRHYLPFGPKFCLSVVLGAGIAGVLFELITMAHGMRRWIVIPAWLALLLLLVLVNLWRRRNLEPPTAVGDGLATRRVRADLIRGWNARSSVGPVFIFEKVYFVVAWMMIGIISLLVLLHGIGLPETYWDSLILYMGYARRIFGEHKFPFKVVGQVGIGLGANYPHLYPLLTAQTATIAGYWSDTFAQLLPPFASFVATLLVYHTAAEYTHDRLTGVSVALLFRAVPYGIAYGQYASDYAIAIVFTAAFLYAAFRYITYGLPAYLVYMLLLAGCAVHINYLMWALWVAAAVAVFVRHWRPIPHGDAVPVEAEEQVLSAHELVPPEFSVAPPANLLRVLRERWFLWTLGAALLLSMPWYIRNVALTGNPVYAFFYNIFPSTHVNAAVMESAAVEWLNNGDGIGRIGSTLGEKLSGSWAYFVTSSLHWKMAPVFVGFVVPGVLLFLAGLSGSLRMRFTAELRFGVTAFVLFALLWFYEYVIADFYLYQIIIVLPLFGVFAAIPFMLSFNRGFRYLLYTLTLIVGFAPGIVMGLMGFKLNTAGEYGGQQYSQIQLTGLKNLFMDRHTFYVMALNGDKQMFDYLSALPPGSKLLTHENRHLMVSDDIQLVHLDDWEIQKAYGKSPAERVAILDREGIRQYLYVPNEDKHRANSWLGMDELITLGYYAEEKRTPSAGSSQRHGLDYKAIPPNMNVLYARTSKAIQ